MYPKVGIPELLQVIPYSSQVLQPLALSSHLRGKNNQPSVAKIPTAMENGPGVDEYVIHQIANEFNELIIMSLMIHQLIIVWCR